MRKTIFISKFIFLISIYALKLKQNWNCFYFVPDSAGWLANPENHVTNRPGLLRWFYERFLSTDQIAFTFYEDKNLVYNQLICDSNHIFLDVVRLQSFLYLFSILFLVCSLTYVLQYRHLVLLSLVLLSGYSGVGPNVMSALDTVFHLLIGTLLGIDLIERRGSKIEIELENQDIKRLFLRRIESPVSLLLFFFFFIPIMHFNYVLPEINAVQSEALSYCLLNISIGFIFIVWFRKWEDSKKLLIFVLIGLLAAGLLLISRLALLGTAIVIIVSLLYVLWNRSRSFKNVILGFIIVFIPTLLLSNSSYKPESSMTYSGPVAYALYAIDRDGVTPRLDSNKRVFVDLALKKSREVFKKYPNAYQDSQPMWLSTGVYLYYGAFPAANELNISSAENPGELEKFFKDLYLETVRSAPTKFIKYYWENTRIAFGLYGIDWIPPTSESPSKILFGPLSLIFIILMIFIIKRTYGNLMIVPLVVFVSVYFCGALASIFFDGPSRRGISTNDFYLVPIIFCIWVAAGRFIKKSSSAKVSN